MFKLTKVALGVIAIGLTFSANAKEEDITIRFPVEYAANISQGLANQDFIERVEKASDGRIKVKFAPDGSMYKGNDLVLAHLRGDVEMTTLVPAYWTTIAKDVQLFDMPYAFPDYESFDRVSADKQFIDKVFKDAEKKGIKVLGLLPNSYLLPGTRDVALKDPSDFKDLKLRAIGKVNAATLKALGANATSINLLEVPAALQQGLVNGIQTLADAYVQYQFQDHIKYITDAHYQLIYYPWTVNKKWFEGLDEKDQEIIQKAVDQAIESNKTVTRDLVSEAMDTLESDGVELIKLSEDQEQKWVKATEKVWDEQKNIFSDGLTDEFLKIRDGN